MNKFFKTSSIFGSLAALNSFIFFYFLLSIGQYPFSNLHLIELLIFAVFIFLAVFQYRAILKELKYSFAQGLAMGMTTALIGVTFYSIFMYVFLEFGMPEVLNFHIKTMTDNWIADKQNLIKMLGKQSFDDTLASLKFTNASSIAKDEFLKKLFFCVMPTVLASVISRRSDIVNQVPPKTKN